MAPRLRYGDIAWAPSARRHPGRRTPDDVYRGRRPRKARNLTSGTLPVPRRRTQAACSAASACCPPLSSPASPTGRKCARPRRSRVRNR